MRDETKQSGAPPAPAPDSAYLVVTEDVEGYRRGMIIPNDAALAKRLAGKTRPATSFDLGVAGIVTRKA
jgi:hypothetical protein